MKNYISTSALFFCSSIVFLTSGMLTPLAAQNIKFSSVNQLESERISKFNFTSAKQWDGLNFQQTGHTIKPTTLSQRSNNLCALSKKVFGWYPYSNGTLYQNLQWDKISDFCYFDYQVDHMTGNNSNSSYNWSTNVGVTTAISNGVNVHICATLFSNHALFFGNTNAQQILITNLITQLQGRNGKGINIDFEGMYSSTLKVGFKNFIINLATQLHTAIPGSELSIAIQWASNAAIDFSALNAYVDFWIHMGYDYSTGSSYAGPTDPLNQFPNIPYWLTSTVNSYLTTYSIPANKFILALPYYGVGWGVNNNCVMGSTNNSTKYTHDISYLVDHNTGYYSPSNLHHDNASSTDYYCFTATDPAGPNEFFIDGVSSMSNKFDIINMNNLAGLGIWALGKDDGTSNYWDLIGSKFGNCNASLPDLTIINPQVSTNSVTTGVPFTVYFAENNDGGASANPNVVSFHLSRDEVLTPGNNGDFYVDEYPVTQPVAAFSQTIELSKQIVIPSNTPPGHYYLFFSADGSLVINENSEQNNFATVQIDVTQVLGCVAGLVSIPISQSVTAPLGTHFNITATSSDPTYQWQVNSGSGWTDLTNTSPYSGVYSPDLILSSTNLGMDGYKYRCHVINDCGAPFK